MNTPSTGMELQNHRLNVSQLTRLATRKQDIVCQVYLWSILYLAEDCFSDHSWHNAKPIPDLNRFPKFLPAAYDLWAWLFCLSHDAELSCALMHFMMLLQGMEQTTSVSPCSNSSFFFYECFKLINFSLAFRHLDVELFFTWWPTNCSSDSHFLCNCTYVKSFGNNHNVEIHQWCHLISN